MAQSGEVYDFMQELRQVMALDSVHNRDEILERIANACKYLQDLEYQHHIQKTTPYERRKFNTELTQMQNQLAKVRQAKIPRKTFQFSSRKYIKKERAHVEQQEEQISYDENRLIKHVTGQEIDLRQRYRNIEPEQLADADINIQDVEQCRIYLPDVQTVFLSDIKDCQIISARVSGAFHCENAVGSHFQVSAHQFRIHHSVSCLFEIEAGSAPIIEKCNQLQFKQRKTAYFGEENSGKWREVRNFSFLKNAKDPNYELLE